MSADLLRQAANRLRSDSQQTAGGEPCEPDLFGLAVADWLDTQAALGHGHGSPAQRAALAVARAYLTP